MKKMILALGLILASAVHAQCYEIVDGLTNVGPYTLKEKADRICVDYQPTVGKTYTVQFLIGERQLAKFYSSVFIALRCACQGGEYVLKYGVDTDWILSAKGTHVTVWMENQDGPGTGELTIDHEDLKLKRYSLRKL